MGLFRRVWRYVFGSNSLDVEALTRIERKLDVTNTQMEVTNRKIDVTNTQMEVTNRKMEVSIRATAALTLRNFNAYRNMTQTSAGNNRAKQDELRKTYYDHCNYSDGPSAG